MQRGDHRADHPGVDRRSWPSRRLVIGIFGYRWIHRVMQATAVVVGVSLVVMLAQGLRHVAARPARPPWPARPPGCSWPGSRCWSSTCCQFGPFVSDYTPLPAGRDQRAGGCSGPSTPGTCWPRSSSCAVGAYLAALLPNARPRSPPSGRSPASGRWSSCALSWSTPTRSTPTPGRFRSWRSAACGGGSRPSRSRVRVIPFLAVMAAGTVIACLGYRSSSTNLTNFLDVLLVLLIPWSRGQPHRLLRCPPRRLRRRLVLHPAAAPTASSPGAACSPTLIGLAAELPFVAQPDYTGPLVARLGGADISWLVGWIVAAGRLPAPDPPARGKRASRGQPGRRPDRLIPRAAKLRGSARSRSSPACPAPGPRGLRPRRQSPKTKSMRPLAFALPPGTAATLTRHHAEPHPMHRRKPADCPGDDTT